LTSDGMVNANLAYLPSAFWSALGYTFDELPGDERSPLTKLRGTPQPQSATRTVNHNTFAERSFE